MSVDNAEVAEDATAVVTPVTTNAPESESPMSQQFTAEDIAKARAQEKQKLYPQVEKLQEELALLKKEREEQQAKEAERAAKRAERAAETAAEKKKQEESELEVRDLLAKKELEFQAQLEKERSEREAAFNLLHKEREYQEVQAYRQQRLEQEHENIIPEMRDLVSGNTVDEIEQSINVLKEKSAKIFESVTEAQQQTRKEMVGSRITLPSSGPLDNDSAQANLSPENIANMSLADYAKQRAKLLGTAGNNRGQGLFG